MEWPPLLWPAKVSPLSKPRKHCAIYTRKSSEEGLEQDFNSLDAQREACEAYAISQKSEGWKTLKTRYDDGGFSGGSMERPALRQLLADIAKGKINVVVVYKIDRLTRALADFARIVELFDKHDVSFVSVTQAFNTTSSMGRLTLNVLLSFAQFEREVTGERIRDKISASKAKGMWMGGTLPLGFDLPIPGSRALVVNGVEAERVRIIFESYLELGSVHELANWLTSRGIFSKQRTTQSGKLLGGRPFSRGALFHMLRNKTYLGLIVHKKLAHPGMHPAILKADLFEQVQNKLNANARRRSASRNNVAHAALTGRIYDEDGQPMSPTFSHGSKGRLYRYYVSAPLQQGQRRDPNDTAIRRVSAAPLEIGLSQVLRRVTGMSSLDPLEHAQRVEIYKEFVHCMMPVKFLPKVRTRLTQDETVEIDPVDASKLRLIIPIRLVRRGGRTAILGVDNRIQGPDPILVKALREAHAMVQRDAAGLPIIKIAPDTPHRRRLIRLAFLAPKLQRAILDGRQPDGTTLAQFLDSKFPPLWADQIQQFRFKDL